MSRVRCSWTSTATSPPRRITGAIPFPTPLRLPRASALAFGDDREIVACDDAGEQSRPPLVDADRRTCAARITEAESGALFEPLRQPDFDERLSRNAEAFGFAIEPVHHPSRGVDTQSLRRAAGTVRLSDIQMARYVLTGVEGAVERVGAELPFVRPRTPDRDQACR